MSLGASLIMIFICAARSPATVTLFQTMLDTYGLEGLRQTMKSSTTLSVTRLRNEQGTSRI
jgi:hypothetical protein